MKKLLSLFLSLCIMGTMLAGITLPASAVTSGTTEAANSTTSGTTGDCTWTLNGTTLTISGNGNMGNYSSSNAAPWGTSITNVIIEDGVTSIGNFAFYNCNSLTSIIIPDSVKIIGYATFENCSSLTSINIPDSATSIDGYAFWGCDSLTRVAGGNGVTSIGKYAFYGCSSLVDIIIGNSVTSIGDSAFRECSNITSITIPDSVTSIDSYAFLDCSSLTSITIPNSVTSIDSSAFSNTAYYNDSSNWQDNVLYIGNHLIDAKSTISGSYHIKSGTKIIAESAFSSCRSLKSITIPDSVTTIGRWAFYACSSLTGITIGNGVTSIGDSAFRDCSNITSITLPDSLISIDSSTFFYCSGLTSITIPDNVTTIGSMAFSYCSGLISATIGKGVTRIDDYAFSSCSSLTSITIPDSVIRIGNSAFSSRSSLKKIYYAGSQTQWNSISKGTSAIPSTATIYYNHPKHNYETVVIEPTCTAKGYATYTCSICGYTYTEEIPAGHNFVNGNCTKCGVNGGTTGDCTWTLDGTKLTISGNGAMGEYLYTVPWGRDITSVVIEDGVTNIGLYAFFDCKHLSSVTIPNSVTSIGNSAFSGCSSLKSITIPNSVTSIGNSAFLGCNHLTSIIIPYGVTSIGKSAFYDCGLTNITIPNSVTSIGEMAFYNCNFKSIIIPNSVTSIGDGAFYECSSLTEIVIPDSVISIGAGTLNYCKNLKKITIPFVGRSIDATSDTSLAHIFGSDYRDIPASLKEIIITKATKIDDYAFYNCSSLISVTLPNSVTSIGERAFYNCSNLTSITIPDSVESIGSNLFDGCKNLTSINIGTGISSIDAFTFGECSSLTDINVSDSNLYYSSQDGVLFNKDKTTIVFFPRAKEGTYTIPDGVININAYAFSNCVNLESINIPNTLRNIGNYAFYCCVGLTSIDIPNSITNISRGAFSNCYGLESITIPKSVTIIGNDAFYQCIALTSIIIPDSVTTIGGGAFYNCVGLTSIVIPDSVITIGGGAFSECYGLKTVYYCGTLDKWNNIDFTNATLIYHNYESIKTEPTCTKTGCILYTCALCNDTYTTSIDALGHNYKSVIIFPTATTQGYTTHTCENCGDSYVDNYTPATGNGVQNMQVVATDTNIVVTWDTPKNISKYNLYVKNENGETLITRELSADRTSVTLSWPSELEWDKNYTIGIRAKTTRWLDTVYKDAALVVGNRIVDVKTQSVGRTIKVNWRAYEGATQYYVYVYKKGAYPTTITSVKATTNSATIINAINPEIDYEVRVIATKGVPKMATADALSINARLNVFTPDTFTERGITPTKVGIGFDEVRGADKYWVYLTPVGGGTEIIKESTKAIAAVAGLAPNTEYTVQIQARITDADGKTHYSGKSAVLGTITTNDWENINFTATKTSSGAKLTWNVPTNAYSYIIYRSTNDGKSYKKLATITDTTITSCIDTTAKSGYIYSIVVQLKDDYVTAKSTLIKSGTI